MSSKRQFSSPPQATGPENRLSIGPVWTSLSSSLPWTSRTFTTFHLELLQHRPLPSSRTRRIQLLGCQNSQTSRSSILVVLSRIDLGQLKMLSLSSCNRIGSVEALAKLASPLLLQLSLDGNCIIYIRSLRKATFPHLNYLNLEDNPVRDIEVLWECPFPLLETLLLESFGGQNTHEGLGWLAKTQSAALGELGLAGGGRIRQKSLLSMLGRKYRSLFVELDEEGSASE